jgi:2-desacetyl-2-hydroxyethyl bacteriochlorophyllide A dehydrogenase
VSFACGSRTFAAMAGIEWADAQRLAITGPGRCEVETVRVPVAPLGPRDVVVRNTASLVSAGTELSMFTGAHLGLARADHWAKYPWCPGYAVTGIVEAIGDEAAAMLGVGPGDRVFHDGNHQTRSRVNLDFSVVRALPDGLDDDAALFHKLLGIALTAFRLAPVRFGEDVAVIGQGLVGILAAQLARESGALRVTGCDITGGRLAMSRACGVDVQLDLRETTLAGADLVIEAVGLAASTDAAIKGVRDGGRVVLLGSARERLEFDPYFDVHLRGVTIVGAHESRLSREQRRADEAFIVHLLASGRVDVGPLVTHRMPYTAAQRAYVGLRDETDTFVGVVLQYA